MKYYAGIGSRLIDARSALLLKEAARYLSACGYRLRSGHADGSIAEAAHPVWRFLKPGAKKLHMRNVHQVLGDSSDRTPSEFVLCWTPEAKGQGGTAEAITIARFHNIPVYDVASDVVRNVVAGLILEAIDATLLFPAILERRLRGEPAYSN